MINLFTNTTQDKEIKLMVALDKLENELKKLGSWSTKELHPNKYKSQSPFCLDTMTLEEWLQFVFIRRMKEILDMKQELPKGVKIFPYAYEYYKKNKEKPMDLLKAIHDIDQIFIK